MPDIFILSVQHYRYARSQIKQESKTQAPQKKKNAKHKTQYKVQKLPDSGIFCYNKGYIPSIFKITCLNKGKQTKGIPFFKQARKDVYLKSVQVKGLSFVKTCDMKYVGTKANRRLNKVPFQEKPIKHR